MTRASVPCMTSRVARSIIFGAVSAGALLATALPAIADEESSVSGSHAVFVLTNDGDANEVIAFERTRTGTLTEPTHYKTGGRGSGGNTDPLASQGALTLSKDRSHLLAVNAGSGTVSVFRVGGAHLELTDRVATEGSEPNAVAEHAGLVYVLNAAASSSVVGFRLENGKLVRIPDSLRFLSKNGASPGSVAFSPDGQFLLVTEQSGNLIDAFKVQPGGLLSSITINHSAGPGVFSVTFTPKGIAIAAETGTSAPNSSAVSSYSVNSDGTLTPISVSLPTLGSANCWSAVTPDGRFVYNSNAGTSTITGFSIGASGALTALPGTIVGVNPSGATNLELAVSADGKFLYSLNGGSSTVGMFAIDQTSGALTNLGTVGITPTATGLDGMTAN